MIRKSTHHYSMTRREVETMLRDWIGLDGSLVEIKSISFEDANLADPQPVLFMTVAQEDEETVA